MNSFSLARRVLLGIGVMVATVVLVVPALATPPCGPVSSIPPSYVDGSGNVTVYGPAITFPTGEEVAPGFITANGVVFAVCGDGTGGSAEVPPEVRSLDPPRIPYGTIYSMSPNFTSFQSGIAFDGANLSTTARCTTQTLTKATDLQRTHHTLNGLSYLARGSRAVAPFGFDGNNVGGGDGTPCDVNADLARPFGRLKGICGAFDGMTPQTGGKGGLVRDSASIRASMVVEPSAILQFNISAITDAAQSAPSETAWSGAGQHIRIALNQVLIQGDVRIEGLPYASLATALEAASVLVALPPGYTCDETKLRARAAWDVLREMDDAYDVVTTTAAPTTATTTSAPMTTTTTTAATTTTVPSTTATSTAATSANGSNASSQTSATSWSAMTSAGSLTSTTLTSGTSGSAGGSHSATTTTPSGSSTSNTSGAGRDFAGAEQPLSPHENVPVRHPARMFAGAWAGILGRPVSDPLNTLEGPRDAVIQEYAARQGSQYGRRFPSSSANAAAAIIATKLLPFPLVLTVSGCLFDSGAFAPTRTAGSADNWSSLGGVGGRLIFTGVLPPGSQITISNNTVRKVLFTLQLATPAAFLIHLVDSTFLQGTVMTIEANMGLVSLLRSPSASACQEGEGPSHEAVGFVVSGVEGAIGTLVSNDSAIYLSGNSFNLSVVVTSEVKLVSTVGTNGSAAEGCAEGLDPACPMPVCNSSSTSPALYAGLWVDAAGPGSWITSSLVSNSGNYFGATVTDVDALFISAEPTLNVNSSMGLTTSLANEGSLNSSCSCTYAGNESLITIQSLSSASGGRVVLGAYVVAAGSETTFSSGSLLQFTGGSSTEVTGVLATGFVQSTLLGSGLVVAGASSLVVTNSSVVLWNSATSLSVLSVRVRTAGGAQIASNTSSAIASVAALVVADNSAVSILGNESSGMLLANVNVVATSLARLSQSDPVNDTACFMSSSDPQCTSEAAALMSLSVVSVLGTSLLAVNGPFDGMSQPLWIQDSTVDVLAWSDTLRGNRTTRSSTLLATSASPSWAALAFSSRASMLDISGGGALSIEGRCAVGTSNIYASIMAGSTATVLGDGGPSHSVVEASVLSVVDGARVSLWGPSSSLKLLGGGSDVSVAVAVPNDSAPLKDNVSWVAALVYVTSLIDVSGPSASLDLLVASNASVHSTNTAAILNALLNINIAHNTTPAAAVSAALIADSVNGTSCVVVRGTGSGVRIVSNGSIEVGSHLIYAATSFSVTGEGAVVWGAESGSHVRCTTPTLGSSLIDFSAPSMISPYSIPAAAVFAVGVGAAFELHSSTILCTNCTYLMRGNLTVEGAAPPLQTNTGANAVFRVCNLLFATTATVSSGEVDVASGQALANRGGVYVLPQVFANETSDRLPVTFLDINIIGFGGYSGDAFQEVPTHNASAAAELQASLYWGVYRGLFKFCATVTPLYVTPSQTLARTASPSRSASPTAAVSYPTHTISPDGTWTLRETVTRASATESKSRPSTRSVGSTHSTSVSPSATRQCNTKSVREAIAAYNAFIPTVPQTAFWFKSSESTVVKGMNFLMDPAPFPLPFQVFTMNTTTSADAKLPPLRISPAYIVVASSTSPDAPANFKGISGAFAPSRPVALINVEATKAVVAVLPTTTTTATATPHVTTTLANGTNATNTPTTATTTTANPNATSSVNTTQAITSANTTAPTTTNTTATTAASATTTTTNATATTAAASATTTTTNATATTGVNVTVTSPNATTTAMSVTNVSASGANGNASLTSAGVSGAGRGFEVQSVGSPSATFTSTNESSTTTTAHVGTTNTTTATTTTTTATTPPPTTSAVPSPTTPFSATFSISIQPLSHYEIYADESWDIIVPLADAVGGDCLGAVLADASLLSSLNLRTLDGGGFGIHVASFSVSPDVVKPLADATKYISMAASVGAVAATLLTGSAVGGAAAEIQAVGVFARMYACTSPRVLSYFGDLRILSPLYMPIFGDDTKSEYLGVLMGNLCFCCGILALQLIVVAVVRMCGNKEHYFATSRFPSITLGAMFSIHTGTVYAASKLLQLADPDSDVDRTKFYIPAAVGVAYYAALPFALAFVAWRFVPRTFFTYDITKFSRENRNATKIFKWFIPVGIMKPDATRHAFGVYVSAFRRASHHWCTSHVWASTIVGIVGFATLDNENDATGSCFLWGILIGCILFLLAVYYALRMPKRHLAFNVLDILVLLMLALLFGFTITWRQISYSPQHRVAESSNENLNWPDLAVIIIGWLVIGLTFLKILLSLIIWVLEGRLLKTNPPIYKLWALEGGTFGTNHQRELSRTHEDGLVFSEMYTLAVADSPARAGSASPKTPIKEGSSRHMRSAPASPTKYEKDAYPHVGEDSFYDGLLVLPTVDNGSKGARGRVSRLSTVRHHTASAANSQDAAPGPVEDLDLELGPLVEELDEVDEPYSPPASVSRSPTREAESSSPLPPKRKSKSSRSRSAFMDL